MSTLDKNNDYSMHNEELAGLLEGAGSRIELKAKEVFSLVGDRMDFILFIREGRTKHYIHTVDGQVKVLFFLGPGWFFGEGACFLSNETGLYSQADTDVVLYKISRKDCERLMKESPLFREKIVECLARKSLFLRHEIENLTFNSCKDRLKSLFCSSADTEKLIDGRWHKLKINYTHAELGEIIGATRVTVSRLLSELTGEEFCRSLNRSIQVNKDALLKLEP